MDLHPGLMIWTIISFLIFFFILSKVAWKPILKALDEREKGIKDNIDAANSARKEAEKALAEYKKQLADAQTEAMSIVSKARNDAERIAEEIRSKAKSDTQVEIERARKQIELESQEAINSIRSEVADLVIFSAKKIIGKTLDSADHKRLILESLKEKKN